MATVERSDVDGVTVLRFVGSLGRTELGDVERSFAEATRAAGMVVVLDLAEVDFMTTPAISMFLDAAKSQKETGGRVVAAGAQPQVAGVLERLRIDALLPVVGSVGEGVARVKMRPA